MARRREKGLGSLYRDKDGNWIGQVDKGVTDNGVRLYKRFKGKTKAEVKEKIDRYITCVKDGTIALDGYYLDDYLRGWLEHIKKPNLKPGSYDRAMTTIRKHIIPFIGHYYVTDLTAKTIQVELIDALYNKGLSYSSIKKAFDYLSASLNYAVDSGKLNRNPCRLIKLEARQHSPKETRFLDDNEIKAFIEAANSRFANGVPKIKVRKLLILALNTGLRVGELCALKWTDIDFSKKSMTVCRNVTDTYNYTNATKQRKKVHLVQNSTKSHDRVVPLNRTAFSLLREMYEEAEDKSGYIAGGSKPGNINTMIKNYKRVCDIAGIKEPHGFHTLRHTFASRLFRKGVDVKVVSSILGHSDTGFTYNTYIHLIEEQAQAAVELLDEEDE